MEICWGYIVYIYIHNLYMGFVWFRQLFIGLKYGFYGIHGELVETPLKKRELFHRYAKIRLYHLK